VLRYHSTASERHVKTNGVRIARTDRAFN